MKTSTCDQLLGTTYTIIDTPTPTLVQLELMAGSLPLGRACLHRGVSAIITSSTGDVIITSLRGSRYSELTKVIPPFYGPDMSLAPGDI